MQTNNTIITYLALGLAVLFWGLSFVATKVALTCFPPFCLIFIRFFIASLFFIILLSKTGFPALTRKNLSLLLLLSILQPGLYFIFETLGLQYTSATKTSLIIATIPVVVLGLSTILLQEKIRITNTIGIFLSLIGVSLLVFGEQSIKHDRSMIIGDMLIFGAVLAAAFYMILTRKLGQLFSSVQITGMQIIFGAVLFFPPFLYQLPQLELQKIHSDAIIAVVGLTIFATIGAFLCYNYALTRIAAARAAVCINGIPLVTAIGAWFLLGETLTFLQLCGGGIVLVAVTLANHSPKHEKVAEIVHEH